MDNAVFTEFYSADELPGIDRREVLRLMGAGGPRRPGSAGSGTPARPAGAAPDAAFARNAGATPDAAEYSDSAAGAAGPLINECTAEALPVLAYRVCWRRAPLSFAPAESRDLAKNLDGCEYLVIFAATAGIGIDRLIAKYGGISPSKALCFQAIGAERTECLCNFFNDKICGAAAEKGLTTRPRFSPGYGDLPLAFQKEMFAMLDCHRKIGLSLNDSLLMSPSKSVTAIIGIAAAPPGTSETARTAETAWPADKAGTAGTAAPAGDAGGGEKRVCGADAAGPGETAGSPCDLCSKTDCLYRRTPV